VEGEERREKGLGGQHEYVFLLFQKNSALAQWYRTRTAGAGKNRKTFWEPPSRPEACTYRR